MQILDPTPRTLDDATSMERARGGDTESFRIVYERHAAAVRGYALGRVGPSGTDDVVSETFAEAWRARASFDPRAPSARPWLYGIATNVVARHREREERWLVANQRAASSAVDVVDEPTAYSIDPELARAIGLLAPALRDVFLLTSLAELSVAETARALGTTAVAARVRLHRARQQLRATLSEGADHA